MTPPRRPWLVVKDANIIIDLANVGLLELWFSLGIPTVTTDFVALELRMGSQWSMVEGLIGAGLLRVVEFESTEISIIHSLAKQHRVSLPDGSVIHLAARDAAHILTGDRRVRRVSGILGLEARGVLWILDTLVGQSVIPKARAASSLRLVVEHGARLPEEEVPLRLESWENAVKRPPAP